jgi:hypothetical protein
MLEAQVMDRTKHGRAQDDSLFMRGTGPAGNRTDTRHERGANSGYARPGVVAARGAHVHQNYPPYVRGEGQELIDAPPEATAHKLRARPRAQNTVLNMLRERGICCENFIPKHGTIYPGEIIFPTPNFFSFPLFSLSS